MHITHKIVSGLVKYHKIYYTHNNIGIIVGNGVQQLQWLYI